MLSLGEKLAVSLTASILCSYDVDSDPVKLSSNGSLTLCVVTWKETDADFVKLALDSVLELKVVGS